MAAVLGAEAVKSQMRGETDAFGTSIEESFQVLGLEVPVGGIVHTPSGGDLKTRTPVGIKRSEITTVAEPVSTLPAAEQIKASPSTSPQFVFPTLDEILGNGSRASSSSMLARFSPEESRQIQDALGVSEGSPFQSRFLDFLSGSFKIFQVLYTRQKLSNGMVLRVHTNEGNRAFKIFNRQKFLKSDASITLSHEKVGEEWQALLKGATDVIAYQGEGGSGQFMRISKQDLEEYLSLKKAASEGVNDAEAALRKNKLALLLQRGPLKAAGVLSPVAPYDAHSKIVGSFGKVRSGFLDEVKCEHFLAMAFPEMRYEANLGSGSFATAMLVRTPEGPKVLRVLNLEKTVFSDDAVRVTYLSSDRIGGEWLSLALSGEHVVNTQEVIAYQYETKHFFRINQQEFKEYLALKEAAENGDPKAVIDFQGNHIAKALKKGPLIAIGTFADFYPGATDLMSAMERVRRRNMNVFDPPEEKIRDYAYQITQGLVDLHKIKGFAHRDVKPDNLLLTADGRILHFDTGLSRLLPKEAKRLSLCGTPFYVAPEVVLAKDGLYKQSVDAYSLFVTLFFIASGEFPHKANSLPVLWKKLENHGEFQKTASPRVQRWQMRRQLGGARSMTRDRDFVSLLVDLNQVDPNKRISVTQAFNTHPFFVRRRHAAVMKEIQSGG